MSNEDCVLLVSTVVAMDHICGVIRLLNKYGAAD